MNAKSIRSRRSMAGVLVAVLAAFSYLHFGGPPAAVAAAGGLAKNASAPGKAGPGVVGPSVLQDPLQASSNGEASQSSPIPATPGNLLAGAAVYKQQCAFCHGFPHHPSFAGTHMSPDATQLWEKHGQHGVVGVSDDPVGETYGKVVKGIARSGMPAYRTLLTSEQMWQVSLLVSKADSPLTPELQTALSPQ